MALAGTVLKRLPLSTAMLYLLVGLAVSPLGLAWCAPEPRAARAAAGAHGRGRGAGLAVHRRPEAQRRPARPALAPAGAAGHDFDGADRGADRRWSAWLFLGLPLGACVLLGAILAPTDPVLASDVQLHEPGDRDRLRFALTGEGGPERRHGLSRSSCWDWACWACTSWATSAGAGWRSTCCGRSAAGLAHRAGCWASPSAGWCCTCAASTRRRWASTTSWRWG